MFNMLFEKGKFIRINFDQSGFIAGANIETCKSRSFYAFFVIWFKLIYCGLKISSKNHELYVKRKTSAHSTYSTNYYAAHHQKTEVSIIILLLFTFKAD